MLLALTANAEKINPMSQNLKTGFFSNLFCQVFRATQIRIYNFWIFSRLVEPKVGNMV